MVATSSQSSLFVYTRPSDEMYIAKLRQQNIARFQRAADQGCLATVLLIPVAISLMDISK
ncbi:unnamed protein product [Rhodiola kirilowii]